MLSRTISWKLHAGTFLVQPSMITITSFLAFVLLAVVLNPEHMNSQGSVDQTFIFGDDGLAAGSRTSCSQAFTEFSDQQHWHSWERGIVAGSATLTVVSILIASAARGEHIQGAYAATGLTIMIESVLFYGLLHSGRTTVYCVGVAGGMTRLEIPLRYAYWIVTNLKMQAALYHMVGDIPQGQRIGALAGSTLAILCGAIAGNIRPYSAASIVLILLAVFFTGLWLAVYAKLCMRVCSWPEERAALKRSILFCVPFATAFPAILVPTTWVLSYAGVLPLGTTQLLFCIGEFMDKFTMCHLLALSDLPQHMDKVRLQLLEAETRRAASQAKESAMRTIMRYLFHELRVPLNSIVLGLDDSKEAVQDLADLLLATRSKFAEVSAEGHSARASRASTYRGGDEGASGGCAKELTARDVLMNIVHEDHSPVPTMPGTSGLAAARKWECLPGQTYDSPIVLDGDSKAQSATMDVPPSPLTQRAPAL